MIDLDHAAITRAAGLLRAFRADDTEQLGAILATDYQGGDPRAAYRTFSAVIAYADRALDWLEHETGKPHEQLLTGFFVPALLSAVDQGQRGQEGGQ